VRCVASVLRIYHGRERYYEEALRISKTVLSSATGQSLASGAEDLTLDFILDMDHLFEQYSQVVLEQELDELSENPLYGELEGVFVRDEPTIHVYEEGTGSYRPDHVLCSDDGTVAVLDSKYYSQDTDPSQHTTSRTSMLAYAYLLETEEMVFLTPSGEEKTRSLAERNGNVTVVSAGSEFTTDSYRDEIREYLMSALDDLSTNTGIRKYVGYPIAHQGVHGTDINEIILNENLELDGDTVSKARSVVEAAIEKSDQVNKHKIYRGADTNAYFQYVKEVKEFILEAEEKYNLVVPFFIPSSADEPVPETGDRKGAEEGDLLKIYAANREDGTITNISEHPKHISLDW